MPPEPPSNSSEDIVAEGLPEIYFQDRGRRAHGLLVDLTDIDYLDVDY
jgi:hypothetical protein